MKSFKLILNALLLSMLLMGTALAADKVNINTADAATLDRVLANVGEVKAKAIIAYRNEHGAFKSAEQLALVKGIGLRTVEKNQERIIVGGGAPSRAAGKVAAR